MDDINNICKFVPTQNEYDAIHTVNFVYEPLEPNTTNFFSKATYTIYMVKEGSGNILFPPLSYPVKKGDIFFSFPTIPYKIETLENGLNTFYISFTGNRATKILGTLDISYSNCVCHGYDDSIEFWEKAFSVANLGNLDMISESVLLYTLSLISYSINSDSKNTSSKIALEIIKNIDNNYTLHDLSIKYLCDKFHYNQKYISSLIKKELHVSFTEYIRTLRVQHACMLMNEGLTNIKDIANLSGYNDSLYFSKVFKKLMKLSPKKYME